jgi:hypothetical protein
MPHSTIFQLYHGGKSIYQLLVWEKSETTSYFKQLPIYTSPIIFIQETIFDPTSISDLSGSGKKILNHISTLPFKLLSCASSISILDRLCYILAGNNVNILSTGTAPRHGSRGRRSSIEIDEAHESNLKGNVDI